MNPYIPNPTCQCPRCRCRGLMGAAVLITLGALFLLSEFWVVSFGESFPALLIVIGVVLYLGRSASTEGHTDRYGTPPPPVAGDQHGPEVNS